MNLKQVVRSISLEDLRNYELCAFCLAAGISIPDALHRPEDMQGGPISSDVKCLHCYDTEAEFGRLRMTKADQRVFQLVDQFNQERTEYLKSVYSS